MQNSKLEQVKNKKIYDIKKRTYVYGVQTIMFIKNLAKDIASVIMAKQLLRAATSIGANIAEARASSSKKDFINFYNHALKSTNETKFWLGLIKDSSISTDSNLDILLNEAEEIAKILATIVLSAKNKRYKDF
jgi:four helix bundle protein